MSEKSGLKKEFAELAKKVLPKEHQGAKITINVSSDGGVSTIEVTTTHR